MAKYNLIGPNGGVRRTFDNVSDVQVADVGGVIRLVGSVDESRLTTQVMAVLRLGDGERLERYELFNQFGS